MLHEEVLKMKEVIFVGWVNQGRAPVDGETTKNQHIIAELEKYCKLIVLDFYEKHRHPWVFFRALWAFVFRPKATIVFSTSASNVYSVLRIMYRLKIKRDIIHWVVGGNFSENVKKKLYGKECIDVFNNIRIQLVQCHSMIRELNKAGVTNACFVPNFKPIMYYPNLEECHKKRDSFGKTRFVFISRIMPEKGCNYILKAAALLNKQGLKELYTIDFYGKIMMGYKDFFEETIKELDNVHFNGLLDLKTKAGYDTLATYHAMLFPSYWCGEGFAGVFVDAFIAGLPVLASDWAHNAECITDGELGVIYPVHDVERLREIMEDCICGKVNLGLMGLNARQEAPKYQADKVITEDYLRAIGLLD